MATATSVMLCARLTACCLFVAGLPPDGVGDLSSREAPAGKRVDVSTVRDSITIVGEGGIPHHFRTTVVPDLLGGADIAGICDLLPSGSPHIQRVYRPVSVAMAAMATGAP